jgi:hypothetical protein
MLADVSDLLREKKKHYGVDGGFYETNPSNDFSHALGETRLKLGEFQRLDPYSAGRRRILVKAITWLYLIYEREVHLGPWKD